MEGLEPAARDRIFPFRHDSDLRQVNSWSSPALRAEIRCKFEALGHALGTFHSNDGS